MNHYENIEILRLQWEYLLRSEKYKQFCLKQRKHKGERDLQYLASLDNNTLGKIFLCFGDIHSKSFDEYWNEETKRRTFTEKLNNIPSLKKYIGTVLEYDIGIDINNVISQYKQFLGKKPTMKELKEGLIMLHDGQIKHCDVIYLMIRGVDTIEKANQATKKIGKLIKKGIIKKRFVKEELERYLRVYDMRKNDIPFSKIHKIVFPQYTNYTENHKRARISDYNKAKTIIKNVETNSRFWW